MHSAMYSPIFYMMNPPVSDLPTLKCDLSDLHTNLYYASVLSKQLSKEKEGGNHLENEYNWI